MHVHIACRLCTSMYIDVRCAACMVDTMFVSTQESRMHHILHESRTPRRLETTTARNGFFLPWHMPWRGVLVQGPETNPCNKRR